jgi:enoyl-CoA hydratase/carnithine racemase
MPDGFRSNDHSGTGGEIKTSITQLSAGKFATVTISRPRKLNALNTQLLGTLPVTIRNLVDSHPDLLAVVLTGEGTKAFVGGADIAEMAMLSSPAEARAFITRIHAACKSIRDCPVPVIARVNGVALGAGLEVAASCDMRIASSTAILGMPEVRMGLPSVVEAALLPGLIGWGRTRQLLLLGDTITAEEGLKWGLVEKVVEPEQLDQAVAGWMSSLEKCGPASVRNQKALMRRWEQLGFDAAIDASIDHFGQAFEKPDQKEGKGEADPEPVRMMGDFLRKQSERRKSKL